MEERRLQAIRRWMQVLRAVYVLSFAAVAAVGLAFIGSVATEGWFRPYVEAVRQSGPLWYTSLLGGVAALLAGFSAMWRYGSLRTRDEPAPERSATTPAEQQLEEHEAKLQARVAMLVVHGIGIQNRFDTLSGVMRGLTQGLAGAGAHWRFEPAGEARLRRIPSECSEEDIAGKRLRLAEQTGAAPRYLDLYEVYWAPLAEGVMTWREVLSWGAGLSTRLMRRLDLMTVGSRAVPHPRDAAPENAAWAGKVHREVRTKALHGVGHLLLILALAAAGGLVLSWIWLVGLGLAAQIPGAACGSCTFTEAAAAMWQAGREHFWVVPEGGGALAMLSGFEHQLDVIARMLAKLPWWGTLIILYLTFVFCIGLVKLAISLGAGKKNPAARCKRVLDVQPSSEEEERNRLTLRARALNWLGFYAVTLTLFLQGPRDANADPELLALPVLVLAMGGLWAALNLGLKPFLSRVLADVPVQADRSPYSKAASKRKQIQEKMIGMLAQALREYDSVVVLAHSQGTVVTYEAFQTYQRRFELQLQEESRAGADNALPSLAGLASYVTIGVALSKVHELVQGYADPSRIDRTVNERVFDTSGIEQVHNRYRCYGSTRWYNYWLLSDLVCNPIRDYLPVEEHLIPWYTLPWSPRAVWTHSDYWDSVAFYEALVAPGPDAPGPLMRAFAKIQPEAP